MRNPLEQNKIPLSHAGFFQTLAIKTKSIYNTNYMMNPEEKKLKDNAKVVPLIALRGLVVFPNTTITVDVGRPKSVRALEEALRRDGKLFFAAQKELINIDPSKEEIFDVGTVCEVLQKIDLPNNNVRLLIKGQYKAKVVEYLKENDYFSVAVEELENKNSDTIVTQALLRQARELLATLCVNVPNKINKELEAYSPRILKKPQLVAANKIDMIDEDDPQYLEFKKYVEDLGYKVFPMSAPLNLGVEEILGAALNELNRIEQDPSLQEENTTDFFDFEAEDNDPTYRDIICGYDEEEDVYTLSGKQLSKIFKSTNFNDMGSLRYLYKYIEKKGAIEQLKELGLEEGDIIRIEDYDLEYWDEF